MSQADSRSQYTFGHSSAAAERLQLLAKVYEPEIRPFLRDWCLERPALAADLGCGPGYTTQMLADETRAVQTVGLDISTTFIELARRSAPTGLSYIEHDVCIDPFPIGPADVLFCHFLLSHLREPASVLTTWSRQLRPGGRILLDEVERIETSQPVLTRYLEIVTALVQHGGGTLEIGPRLDALRLPPGLDRTVSQVAEIDVTTSDAASMFRMNLEIWRRSPFIYETFSALEIEQIANDLDGLRNSTGQGDIRWYLRQIVCERRV
jgi:SAM-dependent methyltransferase